jgi:hypothetical protein
MGGGPLGESRPGSLGAIVRRSYLGNSVSSAGLEPIPETIAWMGMALAAEISHFEDAKTGNCPNAADVTLKAAHSRAYHKFAAEQPINVWARADDGLQR